MSYGGGTVQQLVHNAPLVEGIGLVATELIRLMTLARQQYEVALGVGLVESCRDRGPAILDPLAQRISHPRLDLVQDTLRIFVTRIVARDYRQIRKLGCDVAHFGPFPAIAVASAAKDDYHPPRRKGPDGTQRSLQGIRGVRIVTIDRRSLTQPLQA